MWGIDMKNNLRKAFLLGVLSSVSFTSVNSAPVTSLIADTVSRFEVITVDTPAIAKGSSGVQTATIKNFGPANATNTIAEVRGATTPGVSITAVTWGAGNTACTLSNKTYSCAIGSVVLNATFDLKITYSVDQTAVASTALQQTTLAIKSDQPNPGSGVGESIHRVWGKEGNTQEKVKPYGAFWAGRNKDGACNNTATCGTYSDQTSSMLGFWPVNQKNPQGQYVNQSSTTDNGDTYFYVSNNHQPNPTFETIVKNLTTSPYSAVILPMTTVASGINNLRAWEFETYVYIPASASQVSACVGTSVSMIDDGAYISIQKSTESTPRVVANTVRDKYDSANPYVVSETITTGGYYKLTYRMTNQNSFAKKDQGQYGPIGMSFSGGACNQSELQRLLEMGFPAAITITDKADLAIEKTVDKPEAKVGDLLTYKLKVWNKGATAVTGATVTDNLLSDLASIQVVCKAVGTVICPVPNNITTSNNRSMTLGLLPVMAKDTNNNDTNYLEFTITGLVYKEPSGTAISNTASVAVPSGLIDTDSSNNTFTVNTTITKNTSITTGNANNQCNGNQSVNLITDTAFIANSANNILVPKSYSPNPAVVPYSVAYGTGPNGALELKGKINWSYGIPRITGSTLKIYVNGTAYAVLVTPGASTNNNATFTALEGATVTPVSFVPDKYSTEPTAVNFTLTLPTSLTTDVTSLIVDFQNISPRNSADDEGDDIGFSFNSLNACLKPTVELKKVSTGGTGSFEFDSFSNLSANASYQIQSGEVVTTVTGEPQSIRLKNSSSATESGFTTPVYANAGQDVLFKEKLDALYSLRSVTCLDSNAINSGNSSSALNAIQSGNSVTISKDNLKFGAKLVCTVTNDKKAGYVFSGRVFNDNSGSTKDASKAYNGSVDTGEVGIAGSQIELQNCSTKAVWASTITNANGEFSIQTLQEVFDANNRVCLVQKNVADYQSVSTNKSASVTATADASFDLFTITKNANANTYDGFLFGDAQLQLILTQNGQKNIAAGDVVEYPHEIISKSVHKLGTLNLSNQQQPAIDPVWQSLIYYDANCNGAVDAGEKSYELALQSAPLSAPILPEQKICLVQRVMSPSNAKAGDSLSAQFSVKHTPTMSEGVTSSSNSVRDITTVGSAGLDLVKSVREVKSCPSTSTDTATFVKSNILTKVQNKESYLEYQISYTNNSAKNLVDVVLKDAVPLGTSLKSMCTGGDCTTVDSATPLSWNIAGVLAPRATGTVRFCAQVE
ncbi:hypothetical protein C9E88_004125 [Acinetobacter cumulans]|nr:hypothetical protein C9E88_004125 [Acinetobacter cumulans]